MNCTAINSANQYSYYDNTQADSTVPQHPHSLVRQTTAELLDDLLSSFLRTSDDDQLFEEHLVGRNITDEETSSSSIQSKPPLNKRDALDSESPNKQILPLPSAKRRKVREITQASNENLLDADESELNKRDVRRQKNRITASEYRQRQQHYIEKIEEANTGTLLLGKRLSQTFKKVISAPLNLDDHSSHIPKIKYDTSLIEKQCESLKKTHQWIEDAMVLAVEKVCEQRAQLSEMEMNDVLLKERIAQLEAENTALRTKHTLLQQVPEAPFKARVSPDNQCPDHRY